MIHPTYLPFTEEHLLRHFARADAGSGHTQYYVESARRYAAHMSAARSRSARALADMREPRQIEKDERFWTAATLMAYFHADQRRELFADLLADAFDGQRPLGAWDACLDGDLHLYFEADIPSPLGYQEALRLRVTAHPIPYVRQAASRSSARPLEGPTQVDAVLINASNGFAVLFEAKVLSDVSCLVSFDPARNQIARNVDVMLEAPPRQDLLSKTQDPLQTRDPSRTLFVLLTPQLFKERRAARLYGWLMHEYRRDPSALARDLPHRPALDWTSVSARLGWTTWERSNEILPGACRWLE